MLEVFNSVLSIITSSGEANPGMTSTGGLWLGPLPFVHFVHFYVHFVH